MPPLLYLTLAAAPKNLLPFDASNTTACLHETITSLAPQTLIEPRAVHPPSEAALRQTLAAAAPDLLHLVTHVEARATAQYATVHFVASDGRGRAVNARALAPLLASSQGPRCLVVQAAPGDEPAALQAVATQLVEAGCGCVATLPWCEPAPLRGLVLSFLRQILAGRTPREGIDAARLGAEPGSSLAASIRILGARADQPLLAPEPFPTTGSTSPIPRPASLSPPNPAPDPLATQLRQKRAAGEFDVFLCHNSADKPAVRQLGQQLKARGFLPWLDEWELPPGQPWQRHLERVLEKVRSAAVCFGGSGEGPWQQQEIDALLRLFVKRQSPVIPVLLPGAPAQPDLPLFLQAMTWVDLRIPDPDPLTRLIWGITGKHPEA